MLKSRLESSELGYFLSFLILFLKLLVWRPIELICVVSFLKFSSDKYPILFANSSWVSNSAIEPSAIDRKRANSALDRECPSAILDGTDTAALRN